jgi:hypothetical protein
LIGARTLALLDAAGSRIFHRKLKVPRREVRAIMSWLAITFASPKAINAMFTRAKI